MCHFRSGAGCLVRGALALFINEAEGHVPTATLRMLFSCLVCEQLDTG